MCKLYRLVIISGLFFSAWVCADELENKTVATAIHAVVLCEHWHGEVGDQSAARNAEIEAGSNRDCPRAAQLLMSAYKKYPNNSLLYAPLLVMADYRHITLSKLQLKNLCVTALHIEVCEIQ